MELKTVEVENPEGLNLILGHAHFIKTVEDLYEAVKSSVPSVKFGVAFCEASGPRLVRIEGNDEQLKSLVSKNALNIGAGHTFLIMMRDAFPINLLSAIRSVPETCTIFAATSNPLKVVVAAEGDQRGILGVLDGHSPVGAETSEDVSMRREFLRRIGYKLG